MKRIFALVREDGGPTCVEIQGENTQECSDLAAHCAGVLTTLDSFTSAPAQPKAACGAGYEANGQIIAALMAGLQGLLANPAVQALIASLLSGLIKTPTRAPAAS